jgi:hypothetical protein
MTRKTKGMIAAAVVLLAAGGAGLAWWSGLLADYLDPRPDRKDLVRRYIVQEAKWAKDPAEIDIVKCKHVRRGVLSRVQEKYPTFEIVDCTYRQKDGRGDAITQTFNFWILDEKVFNVEGMTFEESRGREREKDLETYIVFKILQKTDPAEARRMMDEMRKASGASPRGRGRR